MLLLIKAIELTLENLIIDSLPTRTHKKVQLFNIDGIELVSIHRMASVFRMRAPPCVMSYDDRP